MSLDLGAYDQYLLAIVVLIGTYAAAFTLLWVTQRAQYAEFLAVCHSIAQNFLTVINVIFALNLAFLANDTWNARDRGLDAVYREAGSLRNIIDFSGQLAEPQRATLVGMVKDYANLTVTEEWPRLAGRRTAPAVGAQLDALLAFLASKEVTSGLPASVTSQLLQQGIQLRTTRDLRIALSHTHVNPLKWLGMVFLGFLTMISIALVHIDQPRAQMIAVLLFATAAAPTAAIILIHGNPFQDPMAISAAPIAAVATAAETG